MIVGFDQRGCGRSRPWAIDDLDNLDENHTSALIGDIEALREHLGVSAWLVHGVSWGSTLALAYALEHPARVSALVLLAVTTGSREEIDWLTVGVGSIFPEAWHRFAADLPAGARPVEHYAKLFRGSSARVRGEAAKAWDEWESTHISLDPSWKPGPLHDDPRTQENFATLVSHYWAHDCFLTGNARILDRAAELANVEGSLIHGRRDVSSPVSTPWRLHRAWPNSRLQIVETEGHGGRIAKQLAAEAIGTFASR
jgi:proline iminopeptidase